MSENFKSTTDYIARNLGSDCMMLVARSWEDVTHKSGVPEILESSSVIISHEGVPKIIKLLQEYQELYMKKKTGPAKEPEKKKTGRDALHECLEAKYDNVVKLEDNSTFEKPTTEW